MHRKGISLTYKLLGFVLILALVPTVFVAVSSLSTYNDIQSEFSESFDGIRSTALQESGKAKTTAISQTRENLITMLQDNLQRARDDKIDKYSVILNTVESDARTLATYIEEDWEKADNAGDSEFSGMIWAGPNNTQSARSQHDTQIDKMLHIGTMLETVHTQNQYASLVYFGTSNDVVATSKNITDIIESIKPFTPSERPWYQKAKAEQDTVWTNTYIDANSRELTTTVASPVFDGDELLGVIGIDVTLGTLTEDILQADPGFAFLLDSSGEAIVFPGMKARNKTVYAERTFDGTNLLEDDNTSSELQQLAQDMVNGEKGVRKVSIEERKSYVAYGPLETNDWSVGIAIPVSEMTAPADRIEANISTRLDQMADRIDAQGEMSQGRIEYSIRDTMYQYATLFVLLTILVIWSGFYFSRHITAPIMELHEKAEAISKGGIGDELDIHTGDEIEELADSFNRIIRTIKILQKRDAPHTD